MFGAPHSAALRSRGRAIRAGQSLRTEEGGGLAAGDEAGPNGNARKLSSELGFSIRPVGGARDEHCTLEPQAPPSLVNLRVNPRGGIDSSGVY